MVRRDELEEALRFIEERRQEHQREDRRKLGAHLLERIDTGHQRKQEEHQAYLEALRKSRGAPEEKGSEDDEQE